MSRLRSVLPLVLAAMVLAAGPARAQKPSDRVGIDDDGDLSIRVDLTERLLDQDEFKAQVEQVAFAADGIYGGIRQYLKK